MQEIINEIMEGLNELPKYLEKIYLEKMPKYELFKIKNAIETILKDCESLDDIYCD